MTTRSKPALPNKVLTCLLAVTVLLTNTVMAYSAETNFWEERKKIVRGAESVVRSPSNNSLSNKQLANLPLTPNLINPSLIHAPRTTHNGLKSKINLSLPTQFGSIRKITPGQSDTTLIHIQDIHMNPEAQTNIGLTIQELIKNESVDLVALEGAFETIDVSRYRNYNDQKAVGLVADYLLKTHKISGAVHTAFTTQDKIPSFIGIDDQKLYEANVSAVKESDKHREQAKISLGQKNKQLQKQFDRVANSKLKTFHEFVDRYQSGEINLGAYLQQISQYADQIEITLKSFLEAYQLEQELDLTKVEAERSWFLSDLVSKLSDSEKQYLTGLSVAFRRNEITHTAFYRLLSNLCERNDFSLDRYKNMKTYLRYVLLSEEIDAEKLFAQLRQLENKTYQQLAKTPQEKSLIQDMREIYLTEKLVDFSLTREEWDEFRNSSPSEKGRLGGVLIDPSFERFYKVAVKRDQTMTGNLLEAIEKTKAKTVVLITGGFHSKGIKSFLADRSPQKTWGGTIINFVPKITKVSTKDGSSYLGIFTQEKTPLDRIFAGEKLFLPPRVDVPQTAYPFLDELVAAAGSTSLDQARQAHQRINPNISDESLPTKLINNIRERIVRYKNHVWNLSFEQSGEIKSVFVRGVVEEIRVRPWLPLLGWFIYGNLSPPSWIILDAVFAVVYAVLFATVLHPEIQKGNDPEAKPYAIISKERGILFLMALSVGTIGTILPSILTQIIPSEFISPYLQPAVIATTTLAQGLSHGVYNVAAFFLNLPLGLMVTSESNGNSNPEIDMLIEYWKEGVFTDRNRRPIEGLTIDTTISDRGRIGLKSFSHRNSTRDVRWDLKEFQPGSKAKISFEFRNHLPQGFPDQWLIRTDGISRDGSLITKYHQFRKESRNIVQSLKLGPESFLGEFIKDPNNITNKEKDPFKGLTFTRTIKSGGEYKGVAVGRIYLGSAKDDNGIINMMRPASTQFVVGETMNVESVFVDLRSRQRPPQWLIRISGKMKDGKPGELYFDFHLGPVETKERNILEAIDLSPRGPLLEFAKDSNNYTNPNVFPFTESSFKYEVPQPSPLPNRDTIPGSYIDFGSWKGEDQMYYLASRRSTFQGGTNAIVTTEFVRNLPGDLPDQWILHMTGIKKKENPDDKNELVTIHFRFTTDKFRITDVDLSAGSYLRSFMENPDNIFDQNTQPFPQPYLERPGGKPIYISPTHLIAGFSYADHGNVRVSPHFIHTPPRGMRPQWVLRVIGKDKKGELLETFHRMDRQGGLFLLDLTPKGYVTAIAEHNIDVTNPKIRPFEEPSFVSATNSNQLFFGRIEKNGVTKPVRAESKKLSYNKNYLISPVFIDEKVSGLPKQWMLRLERTNRRKEVEQLYFRFTQNGTYLEEIDLKLDHDQDQQLTQLVNFALQGRKAWTNPHEKPMVGSNLNRTVRNGRIQFKKYENEKSGQEIYAQLAGNDFENGTIVKISVEYHRHLAHGYPDQWLIRAVGKEKASNRVAEKYYRFRNDGTLSSPIELSPENHLLGLAGNPASRLNPHQSPMRTVSFRTTSRKTNFHIGIVDTSQPEEGEKIFRLPNGRFKEGTELLVHAQFVNDMPGDLPTNWVIHATGLIEKDGYPPEMETLSYIITDTKQGSQRINISPRSTISGFRYLKNWEDPRIDFLNGQGFLTNLRRGSLNFPVFKYVSGEKGIFSQFLFHNFQPDSPVAVSSTFSRDNPDNQANQWAIRVIGLNKNNELDERLLKFADSKNGLALLHRSQNRFFANHFDDIENTYDSESQPVPELSLGFDFNGYESLATAKPSDRAEFDINFKSKLFQKNSNVNMFPRFQTQLPGNQKPQWLFRFEGISEKDESFIQQTKRYNISDNSFSEINLAPIDFLTSFAKDPKLYTDKNTPPFLDPYIEVTKKSDHFMPSWTTESGDVKRLDLRGSIFPNDTSIRLSPLFLENHSSGLPNQWLIRVTGIKDEEIAEQFYRFDYNQKNVLQPIDLDALTQQKKKELEKEDQKLRNQVDIPEAREIIKWLAEGVKTRKSKPPFKGVSFHLPARDTVAPRAHIVKLKIFGQRFDLMGNFIDLARGAEVTVSSVFLENLPGRQPDQWGLRFTYVNTSGQLVSHLSQFSTRENGVRALKQVDYSYQGYMRGYIYNESDFSKFHDDPLQGRSFTLEKTEGITHLGKVRDKNGTLRFSGIKLPFKKGTHYHMSSVFRDDLPDGSPPQWLLRFSGLTKEGETKEIYLRAIDEERFLTLVDFSPEAELGHFSENPDNFENPNQKPFSKDHFRIKIPNQKEENASDIKSKFLFKSGPIQISKFEPGTEAIVTYSFMETLPNNLPAQWVLKISGVKRKNNSNETSRLETLFYRFREGPARTEYVELDPIARIPRYSRDPKAKYDPQTPPFHEPFFDRHFSRDRFKPGRREVSLRLFDISHPIRFSTEFYTDLPSGLEPQWIVRTLGKGKNGQPLEKYWRFQEGSSPGLTELDFSPRNYLAQYANPQNINRDEKNVPSPYTSFVARTEFGNSRIYFGSFFDGTQNRKVVARSKKLSMKTEYLVSSLFLEERQTGMPDQWFIRVEGKTDNDEIETIYFRYTDNGTYLEEVELPQEKDHKKRQKELGLFALNGPYTNRGDLPMNGISLDRVIKNDSFKLISSPGIVVGGTTIFPNGRKISITPTFKTNMPGNKPDQWVLRVIGVSKDGKIEEGFYEFTSSGVHLKNSDLTGAGELNVLNEDSAMIQNSSKRPLSAPSIKIKMAGTKTKIRVNEFGKRGFTQAIYIQTSKFVPGSEILVQPHLHKDPADGAPTQWILKVAGQTLEDSIHKGAIVEEYLRVVPGKRSPIAMNIDDNGSLSVFYSSEENQFNQFKNPLKGRAIADALTSSGQYAIHPFFAETGANFPGRKNTFKKLKKGSDISVDMHFGESLPLNRPNKHLIRVIGIDDNGKVQVHYAEPSQKSNGFNFVPWDTKAYLEDFLTDFSNHFDPLTSPLPSPSGPIDFLESNLHVASVTPTDETKTHHLQINLSRYRHHQTIQLIPEFHSNGMPYGLEDRWVFNFEGENTDGDFERIPVYFDQQKRKLLKLDSSQKDHILAFANDPKNFEDPSIPPFPDYDVEWKITSTGVDFGSWNTPEGPKRVRMSVKKTFGIDSKVLVSAHFLRDHPSGVKNQWVLRVTGVVDGKMIEKFYHFTEGLNVLQSIDLTVREQKEDSPPSPDNQTEKSDDDKDDDTDFEKTIDDFLDEAEKEFEEIDGESEEEQENAQRIYQIMLSKGWDAVAKAYANQRENLAPFWQSLFIYSWVIFHFPRQTIIFIFKSVLITAAGPLGVTFPLLRRQLEAKGATFPRVVELDLSQKMLEEAIRKDDEKGFPQPIRIRGNMARMPFQNQNGHLTLKEGTPVASDDPADMKIEKFTFVHLGSLGLLSHKLRGRAIVETNRVMADGGYSVISTNNKEFTPGFLESVEKLGFELVTEEPVRIQYTDTQRILLRSTGVPEEAIKKITKKVNKLKGHFIILKKVRHLSPEEAVIYRFLDFTLDGYRWMKPEGKREDKPLPDDFDLTTLDYNKIPPSLFFDQNLEDQLWKRIDHFFGPSRSHSVNEKKAYSRARERAKERMRAFLNLVRESDTTELAQNLRDPEFRENRIGRWQHTYVPPENELYSINDGQDEYQLNKEDYFNLLHVWKIFLNELADAIIAQHNLDEVRIPLEYYEEEDGGTAPGSAAILWNWILRLLHKRAPDFSERHWKSILLTLFFFAGTVEGILVALLVPSSVLLASLNLVVVAGVIWIVHFFGGVYNERGWVLRPRFDGRRFRAPPHFYSYFVSASLIASTSLLAFIPAFLPPETVASLGIFGNKFFLAIAPHVLGNTLTFSVKHRKLQIKLERQRKKQEEEDQRPRFSMVLTIGSSGRIEISDGSEKSQEPYPEPVLDYDPEVVTTARGRLVTLTENWEQWDHRTFSVKVANIVDKADQLPADILQGVAFVVISRINKKLDSEDMQFYLIEHLYDIATETTHDAVLAYLSFELSKQDLSLPLDASNDRMTNIAHYGRVLVATLSRLNNANGHREAGVRALTRLFELQNRRIREAMLFEFKPRDDRRRTQDTPPGYVGSDIIYQILDGLNDMNPELQKAHAESLPFILSPQMPADVVTEYVDRIFNLMELNNPDLNPNMLHSFWRILGYFPQGENTERITTLLREKLRNGTEEEKRSAKYALHSGIIVSKNNHLSSSLIRSLSTDLALTDPSDHITSAKLIGDAAEHTRSSELKMKAVQTLTDVFSGELGDSADLTKQAAGWALHSVFEKMPPFSSENPTLSQTVTVLTTAIADQADGTEKHPDEEVRRAAAAGLITLAPLLPRGPLKTRVIKTVFAGLSDESSTVTSVCMQCIHAIYQKDQGDEMNSFALDHFKNKIHEQSGHSQADNLIKTLGQLTGAAPTRRAQRHGINTLVDLILSRDDDLQSYNVPYLAGKALSEALSQLKSPAQSNFALKKLMVGIEALDIQTAETLQVRAWRNALYVLQTIIPEENRRPLHNNQIVAFVLWVVGLLMIILKIPLSPLAKFERLRHRAILFLMSHTTFFENDDIWESSINTLEKIVQPDLSKAFKKHLALEILRRVHAREDDSEHYYWRLAAILSQGELLNHKPDMINGDSIIRQSLSYVENLSIFQEGLRALFRIMEKPNEYTRDGEPQDTQLVSQPIKETENPHFKNWGLSYLTAQLESADTFIVRNAAGAITESVGQTPSANVRYQTYERLSTQLRITRIRDPREIDYELEFDRQEIPNLIRDEVRKFNTIPRTSRSGYFQDELSVTKTYVAEALIATARTFPLDDPRRKEAVQNVFDHGKGALRGYKVVDLLKELALEHKNDPAFKADVVKRLIPYSVNRGAMEVIVSILPPISDDALYAEIGEEVSSYIRNNIQSPADREANRHFDVYHLKMAAQIIGRLISMSILTRDDFPLHLLQPYDITVPEYEINYNQGEVDEDQEDQGEATHPELKKWISHLPLMNEERATRIVIVLEEALFGLLLTAGVLHFVGGHFDTLGSDLLVWGAKLLIISLVSILFAFWHRLSFKQLFGRGPPGMEFMPYDDPKVLMDLFMTRFLLSFLWVFGPLTLSQFFPSLSPETILLILLGVSSRVHSFIGRNLAFEQKLALAFIFFVFSIPGFPPHSSGFASTTSLGSTPYLLFSVGSAQNLPRQHRSLVKNVIKSKKEEILQILSSQMDTTEDRLVVEEIEPMPQGTFKYVFAVTLRVGQQRKKISLRFHQENLTRTKRELAVATSIQKKSGGSVKTWKIWSARDFYDDPSMAERFKAPNLLGSSPGFNDVKAVSIGEFREGKNVTKGMLSRNTKKARRIANEMGRTIARIWLSSVRYNSAEDTFEGIYSTDIRSNSDFFYNRKNKKIEVFNPDFGFRKYYPINAFHDMIYWGLPFFITNSMILRSFRAGFFREFRTILHGRRLNPKQQKVRDYLDSRTTLPENYRERILEDFPEHIKKGTPAEFYQDPASTNRKTRKSIKQEDLNSLLDNLERDVEKGIALSLQIDLVDEFNSETTDINQQTLDHLYIHSSSFQTDIEIEKGNLFSLMSLAHYILEKGPENFSEDQMDRIESIINEMKKKKMISEGISLPYLFILSLSSVFKGARGENTFIKYSKRFEKLPGSYATRTVALNLFLKSRHIANHIAYDDWTDIEIVASHISFSKEQLNNPSLDPSTQRILKLGIGYFLISTLHSLGEDDPLKLWLWFDDNSFDQAFHLRQNKEGRRVTDKWNQAKDLFKNSLIAAPQSTDVYDPLMLRSIQEVERDSLRSGNGSFLRRAWAYQLPFYFALSQFQPRAYGPLENVILSDDSTFTGAFFVDFENWVSRNRLENRTAQLLDDHYSLLKPSKPGVKFGPIKSLMKTKKNEGHNFDKATYWNSWRGFVLGGVVNSILYNLILIFFVDWFQLSILIGSFFIFGGFISLAGFNALANLYGDQPIAKRNSDGSKWFHPDFDVNTNRSMTSLIGHNMVNLHESSRWHNPGLILMVSAAPILLIHSLFMTFSVRRSTSGPLINLPELSKLNRKTIQIIIAGTYAAVFSWIFFGIGITFILSLILFYIGFHNVHFLLVRYINKFSTDESRPNNLIAPFQKLLRNIDPIDFEDPFWIETFLEMGIKDNNELLTSLFVSIRGELIPTVNLARAPTALQWITYLFFFPEWHNYLSNQLKRTHTLLPYLFQPLSYLLVYSFLLALFSPQTMFEWMALTFTTITVGALFPFFVQFFWQIFLTRGLPLTTIIESDYPTHEPTSNRIRDFRQNIKKMRKNKFIRRSLSYFIHNSEAHSIGAHLSIARDPRYMGGRGYSFSKREGDFLDKFENAFIWIDRHKDTQWDYRTATHEFMELVAIQFLAQNFNLTEEELSILESHEFEFIEMYGVWLELIFADQLGYDLETKDLIAFNIVDSMRKSYEHRSKNFEAIKNNPNLLKMYKSHMDAYENSLNMRTMLPFAYKFPNQDERHERVQAVLKFLNRTHQNSPNFFVNHVQKITKSSPSHWWSRAKKTTTALLFSASLLLSPARAPAQSALPTHTQIIDQHRQTILTMTENGAVQSMGYSQLGNKFTTREQKVEAIQKMAKPNEPRLLKKMNFRNLALIRRQS